MEQDLLNSWASTDESTEERGSEYVFLGLKEDMVIQYQVGYLIIGTSVGAFPCMNILTLSPLGEKKTF